MERPFNAELGRIARATRLSNGDGCQGPETVATSLKRICGQKILTVVMAARKFRGHCLALVSRAAIERVVCRSLLLRNQVETRAIWLFCYRPLDNYVAEQNATYGRRDDSV